MIFNPAKLRYFSVSRNRKIFAILGEWREIVYICAMKRKFFCKLALVAAMLAPALTATAEMPVRVGVRTGVNFSEVGEKRVVGDAIGRHTCSDEPGFILGAVVDIPVARNVALQPGFYYDFGRFKYTTDMLIHSTAADGTPVELQRFQRGDVTEHWFLLPVLGSYRIDIRFAELQLDFGPYFALGLGGRDKFTETFYSGEVADGLPSETIKQDTFGKGPDARYHHYNWGFDIGFGLEFAGHYYAGVHWLGGCRNLARDKDTVSKSRTSEWQIAVGYNF